MEAIWPLLLNQEHATGNHVFDDGHCSSLQIAVETLEKIGVGVPGRVVKTDHDVLPSSLDDESQTVRAHFPSNLDH